jgi:hypothetical protein
MMLLRFLWIALVLGFGTAQAHWSDLSAAEVQLEADKAKLTLTFPTRLLESYDSDKNGILSAQELNANKAAITDFFAQQIVVTNGEKPAALEVFASNTVKNLGPKTNTHSTVRLEYTLPNGIKDFRMTYNLFVPNISTASCVATFLHQGKLTEVIFRPESREFRLESEAAPVNFWAWIGLGIEHILTGYDHLLFVLSLLMLGAGLPYLLKVITAFTVAHSISLSLAAFGILTLPSKFVESGIALTIAYVAAENLFHKNPTALSRSRWALTFGFGLIHGLGFAGVLEEIGLPREHAALSLLGFNLGVELGQLALAMMAGLFWFVERVMG